MWELLSFKTTKLKTKTILVKNINNIICYGVFDMAYTQIPLYFSL